MSDTISLPGMIEPELLVATRAADGRIISRNEAWASVLGDEEEFWGRLFEEDRRTAEQNFREACKGSLVTNALFLAVRQNRDLPAPVLLNFIPVSPSSSEGSPGSDLVVITGEILAEPDTWTENQTDKHRMETLGRMTMGITHDFNNLLSGILGHIDIMRSEGLLERLDASVKEQIDTIGKAAENGAALVSKIQRYIRQEKKSAFEPVDLAELIRDCLTLTRPYWFNEPRRQGIEINASYENERLLPIMGSGPDLRDVFVNLILNAVQAMPDGGNITIKSDIVDDEVCVYVRDSGMGMRDDVRARIFEPLFTTKSGRGSGMGLSVVLGTIQEHEGRISVTSAPEEGTEFSIALPLLVQTSDAVETPSSSTATGSAHILVVDDEEMVRKVVTRLLTLRGHDVRSTSSAGEALEILSDQTFDIIISDQGMPGMNGREFAEMVQSKGGNIPFVLLTGDTDISVDPSYIHRVISKPFKVDELDQAISDLT